jgi:hypothetical protein
MRKEQGCTCEVTSLREETMSVPHSSPRQLPEGLKACGSLLFVIALAVAIVFATMFIVSAAVDGIVRASDWAHLLH